MAGPPADLLDLKAWLRLDLDDPDPVTRSIAIQELAEPGQDSDIVERLRVLADSDPDPTCRRRAVEAVTILGRARGVIEAGPRPPATLETAQQFYELFAQTDVQAKIRSIQAIRVAPADFVLDFFRQQVQEETDPPVLVAELKLLGRFGDEADAHLARERLANPATTDVALAAIDLLADKSPPLFLDQVPALLASADLRVRSRTLRWLSAIDHPNASRRLGEMIGSRDPASRHVALKELLLTPPAEARPLLLQLLGVERSPSLLVMAGLALATNPDPDLPAAVFDIGFLARGIKQHILQRLLQQVLSSIQAAGILTVPVGDYLVDLKARLAERKLRLQLRLALNQLGSADREVRQTAMRWVAGYIDRPEVLAAVREIAARPGADPELQMLMPPPEIEAPGLPMLESLEDLGPARDKPPPDVSFSAPGTPPRQPVPPRGAPPGSASPALPTTSESPASSTAAPVARPATQSPDGTGIPAVTAAPPTRSAASPPDAPASPTTDPVDAATFLAWPPSRQSRWLMGLDAAGLRQHRDWLRKLKDRDLEKRVIVQLLAAFGLHGEPGDLGLVRVRLGSDEPAVVAEALTAMARLDPDGSATDLVSRLNHTDPQIRLAALGAYLTIDKDQAVQYLSAMLCSTQRLARTQGLSLLPSLDFATAEPLLLDFVRRERDAELLGFAAYLLAANLSLDGLWAVYQATHDADGAISETLGALWQEALRTAETARPGGDFAGQIENRRQQALRSAEQAKRERPRPRPGTPRTAGTTGPKAAAATAATPTGSEEEKHRWLKMFAWMIGAMLVTLAIQLLWLSPDRDDRGTGSWQPGTSSSGRPNRIPTGKIELVGRIIYVDPAGMGVLVAAGRDETRYFVTFKRPQIGAYNKGDPFKAPVRATGYQRDTLICEPW